MTEDGSLMPLVNGLTGGFIALLTIAAPLGVVLQPTHFTNLEESVKINKLSNKSLLYDHNHQRVRPE